MSLQSHLLPRLFSLFFVFVAVAPIDVWSAARVSAAQTISHQHNGDSVAFTLPPDALRVVLQGQHPRTAEWVDLAAINRPSSAASRLKVPRGWRSAPLRVLAYIETDTARSRVNARVSIKKREVVFATGRGPKLYSIESRAPGATEWSRISTVAAPQRPRSIRVPLPSAFAPGTQVRVMAVSGAGKALMDLDVPLSPQLRDGPSNFAARLQAVSEEPLSNGEVSLLTSASGDFRSSATVAVDPQESDIWKIRGKKIYFFNHLRGLQVIDVGEVGADTPADPSIAGSLPLAGAGEEMYLLGGDESAAASAVLIAALPWSPSAPEATRLHRVRFDGDVPAPETSLDLPGYYVESRLVGGLLHVVTSSWGMSSGRWSPRTYVTTVDLSQNGTLVASAPIELETSPQAVGSTSKYLWIAARSGDSWWQHRLFVFPYRSDGSLTAPMTADLAGTVQDKFKVGDTADGLAAVTMNWESWQRITSVETFREEAGGLVRAAQPLELVRGESLFASRFDGEKLYVVTFEQVDPLWIVDLSDPSNPQIRGHLEVPGWSNYIQPLGDVLLAVGRDGGKVQVSMFDVSDPDNPIRTALVDLGQADGWSWTEAEWNEKAVKILPEAGMMLVPVVEWNNGTRSNRVALVDFDIAARTLTARGTIDHDFAPRRAALMDDSVIASVSNRELLLVDASDRANPAVVCELTLAFGVDKVVVHDGTLLMFEHGGESWRGAPQSAVLRTAPASDPDNVAQEFPLPCTEVAAAGVFGGRLVVVEASSSALSVWSLENPASPVLIGRTPLPFQPESGTEILPAEGGRLVIVSRLRGWGHWVRPLPMPVAVNVTAAASVARISLPWGGWGEQGLKLAVTDVAGVSPRVLGTWQLEGEGYSEVSQVHSAGDLLVFSYDRRDQTSAPDEYAPLWAGSWKGWNTRSWLQVLDLADPAAPMPWAPVELPGALVGVSWMQRAGGVVFARTSTGVAALGFDGEFASLAAEVPVQGAIAMQGATLYEAAEGGVKEWKFSESAAAWQPGPGWSFRPGQNIASLHVADGALLAGGYGLAWVLGEDGSVESSVLPHTADLGSAERVEESFVVPAGEYGVVRIP